MEGENKNVDIFSLFIFPYERSSDESVWYSDSRWWDLSPSLLSHSYNWEKNLILGNIFNTKINIFPAMFNISNHETYLEANNLLASDSRMCLLHFPNSSLMGVFGLTASLYLEMKWKRPLSRFNYINPDKSYLRVFNDPVSEWNFSSLIFKFS